MSTHAHAATSAACPFHRVTEGGLAASVRRVIQGVARRFDRWLDRAPFPEAVAHFRRAAFGGGLANKRGFHRFTVTEGKPASDFFETSGIRATAEANGGVCSFRLGEETAIYQSRNVPLLDDDDLAPSLDANRALFGDFMGSMSNADPVRRAKRVAIESTLGSPKFLAAVEPEMRRHARDFLAACAEPMALDEFALRLVAYVDSMTVGILDLRQRPLTEFLQSPEYGRLARDFFEIASEVISKANPSAIKAIDTLVPFIRELLRQNFESIAAAPDTNLIRRSFEIWGLELTRENIASLEVTKVNELATLIVATYDTTCLSFLWALVYVESDPRVKARLVAGDGEAAGEVSYTEQVVLEAVRLGGSNPTALYRRLVKDRVLRIAGQDVRLPAGTLLWLDRRFANQDGHVFPQPTRFDLDNVRALVRSPRETLSSLLSRGRYEINSFSMVNTVKNPRKCPGRLFSVRQQALLLEELYGGYVVSSEGIDLSLKPFSSMPRPRSAGTLSLTPRITEAAGTHP